MAQRANYGRQQQQPPPTRTEVFAMLSERRSILAGMHSEMLIVDDFLHSDDTPSPVEGYINKNLGPNHAYVIYPYGQVVHNRGLNQIMTAEVPEVTYSLRAKDLVDNPKWADDEKAIQQWAQGLLYQIVTRSTQNPFTDLLSQQLGPGFGGLHYPLDYDALSRAELPPEELEPWEAYERQSSSLLPWKISSLHPTWIFFDTAHDPPEDYIIERPVSMQTATRLYPDLQMSVGDVPAGSQTDSAQTYVEYVSPRWYGAWIGGTPILEDAGEDGIAENTCGHTWVRLAFSGFGKLDRYGDWRHRGLSQIHQMLSMFKSMMYADNVLSFIQNTMIPKYLAQGQDFELTRQDMADFDPLSPSTGVLRAGTTLRPMDPPQIPPALIEDIRQYQAKLEQMAGPGILSGQDAGASEPASKWAARTEAARGPYRAPKKNAEQCVANMLADMAWDMAHEPALAGGHTAVWTDDDPGKRKRSYSATVKPEQFHPGGTFDVDFSPMSVEERQAKIDDAKAKQDAGWISTETAMKDGAEIDDTSKEMAEIMADSYMASDAYLQRLDTYIGPMLDEAFGVPPPLPPAPAEEEQPMPASEAAPASPMDSGMSLPSSMDPSAMFGMGGGQPAPPMPPVFSGPGPQSSGGTAGFGGGYGY